MTVANQLALKEPGEKVAAMHVFVRTTVCVILSQETAPVAWDGLDLYVTKNALIDHGVQIASSNALAIRTKLVTDSMDGANVVQDTTEQHVNHLAPKDFSVKCVLRNATAKTQWTVTTSPVDVNALLDGMDHNVKKNAQPEDTVRTASKRVIVVMAITDAVRPLVNASVLLVTQDHNVSKFAVQGNTDQDVLSNVNVTTAEVAIQSVELVFAPMDGSVPHVSTLVF